MSSGIHVVIFCAVDYQFLLSDCLESLKQNVQDDILSITVIANAPLNTEHKVILDRDLWKKIDPNFHYKNLYKQNWVKQQILKLSVDYLFQGNILVCDVDIRFPTKIQFCKNNQTKVFYIDDPFYDSPIFVQEAIGILPSRGYMTNLTVFASDLLSKLRKKIEHNLQTNILEAYQYLIYHDPKADSPELKVFMSEYELYNNFLVHYHPTRVWDKIFLTRDCYYSLKHEIQTMDSNTDTQWINFYEQIKDSSWPDCWRESDFGTLPEHVQRECIDVYGYKKPK